MSNLNLTNLKINKNEILKVEIGTVLFNLGKTHAGISNWKPYFPNVSQVFSGYKEYYDKNHFENELENIDNKLKDFIFNKKVKLPDNSEIDWKEFFFGDASDKDFIKKIFFRGCENINSGIDKGTPTKKLDALYIANAFGSFKYKPKENDFDMSRECFFQNFHRFLEDNNFYNATDWNEIRKFVIEKIKSWYSRLLSDSRFPINDVTLFDQAYMTASMFKSTLSGLFLNNSKDQNGKSRQEKYIKDPQLIKWSILGIQYDKLALSEKGLKAASIKWYRETSDRVDNSVKALLEIDYPIGNEVYRDETGIYFVVAENLIGDKVGDFYKLHSDLNKIKNKIQEIFSNNFKGEIYPAIFLTEPSRGLMNLGHLLEKAKENFLKAEIPNNFISLLKHDKNPSGKCEICKFRLANKQNKEKLICDVCKKRMDGRIDNWISNLDKETIWLDELQDKNGRIALVTLKFELDKWINGDLVNSLMFQIKEENNSIDKINNFIFLFLSNKQEDFSISNINRKISILQEQLRTSNTNKQELGQEKRKLTQIKNYIEKIKKYIDEVKNKKWWLKQLNEDVGIPAYTGLGIEKLYNKIIEIYNNNIKPYFNISLLDNISFFPKEFSEDAYTGCKTNNESFDDYIMQIFFGSILGTKWEKFIKLKLGNKIDFKNRQVKWQNLTDSEIKFLSELILQFLLRKNPSPARLRRIWETTREFFENLEIRLVEMAKIKEERKKRLVWSNTNISDGEYQDGDILFWAKDDEVYLISSIEKIRDKKEFKLKKYREKTSDIIAILRKEEAKEHIYKPYFTILSPTPISWQFIIPAENLPQLINNIKEEYYKHFKWVYGKLPLHIGVIIQDYKKPLYIGIKALRQIRRDNTKWFDLRKEISAKELRARQKKAFYYQELPEKISDCENFYSLFEKISGNKKYEFYLYPETEQKQKLNIIQNSNDADKFYFYPNTLDFEFLDTNTRRNDIFYKKAKRFMKLKQNRPYDIEDWNYFEKFIEYFKDKKTSSKLQKLISLVYSKLEDWKEHDESLKKFFISSFINVLELKREEEKNGFAKIFGVDSFNKLKRLSADEFTEKLLTILDMFLFWHQALKFL